METVQVKIHEAKTQLSKLIQEVLRGKEVIIAKGDKPLVRLEALPEVRTKRKIGNVRGLVLSIADDFDQPIADFKEYME